MKKLMCALMGLLIMLTLFGCSSKKPTEKMVEQDVLTYVNKVYPGFEIQNFKIERSKTEKDEYYADISCSIKKSFLGKELSGTLYYTKFDGGKWENVSQDFSSSGMKFTALPTESEILSGVDGYLDPLTDRLYDWRIYRDSTIRDIKVLNIEKSAENSVYADISWVDDYQGYIGQIYGAVEIDITIEGVQMDIYANPGEVDFGPLIGKTATQYFFGYTDSVTIEECSLDRLVLNHEGDYYYYNRVYDAFVERPWYNTTRFAYAQENGAQVVIDTNDIDNECSIYLSGGHWNSGTYKFPDM